MKTEDMKWYVEEELHTKEAKDAVMELLDRYIFDSDSAKRIPTGEEEEMYAPVYKCSNCEEQTIGPFPYCHHCGVKFFEEEDAGGKKYRRGPKIASIAELLRMDFIYYRHKVYHHGWFQSWTLAWTKGQIEQGSIFQAIPSTSQGGGKQTIPTNPLSNTKSDFS